MTVVVDASVAMRWLFQFDDSAQAEDLLQSNDQLVAPDLVLAEIANAAWKLVTFDGTRLESAIAGVLNSAKHFDELVPATALKDRAFQIAIDLRHPAYDCFYLALAERRDCTVVTADARLLRRCANTPFADIVRPLQMNQS
jgi:predicted nucleic acid-binding protein